MISFENVSFSYDARSRKSATAWAVKNISLTLGEGEMLGLAGCTGSGKSTIAQLASGLIAPQEGRVLLAGESLKSAAAASKASMMVGMAFQSPERQLFAPTVREDVAFGPRNLGLSKAEAEERAHAALLQVGIDSQSIEEANPFHLSGGQRRRVALAGILAMNPRVLVLDEPSAGLDPRAREEILTLVQKLNREDGLSIILISHDMDELARYCDRVALLHEGEIAAIGRPQDVFLDSELLERIGLEAPEAIRFAEKIKRAGLTLPADEAFLDARSLAKAIAIEHSRRYSKS